MKNLYLFIFLLFFIGCSSSDDGDNNSSDSGAFHPPSWIHGIWSFDEQTLVGFSFTDRVFCSLNTVQENCFPEQESEGYDVDENISSTEYSFTIVQSALGQVVQTSSYHFVKVDVDHIIFDDPNFGDRTMYKME